MPLDTGIYTEEEAVYGHDFSYRLAKWIGEYLPKNKSVIDIGCGPAWYLRYLHDIGFTSLLGIEGTPQNFEYGNVVIQDLTQPTRYESDYAISLEVGEHIPEEYLSVFIDTVAQAKRKVILSWAIPGQDGIGHVSCKHNIWVIDEMAKRGFRLNVPDTLTVRTVVEDRVSYFRNTLMIFDRI